MPLTRVWIRLNLPDREFRLLRESSAGCELWRGEDAEADARISPRIGGAMAERWDLLLPIFIENLKRFVAGERLHNLVDKERGY